MDSTELAEKYAIETVQRYMDAALKWTKTHKIAEPDRGPYMIAFVQACAADYASTMASNHASQQSGALWELAEAVSKLQKTDGDTE